MTTSLDTIPDFRKEFHIANDASVIHVVNKAHGLYVAHHGHNATTKVQWPMDHLAALSTRLNFVFVVVEQYRRLVVHFTRGFHKKGAFDRVKRIPKIILQSSAFH